MVAWIFHFSVTSYLAGSKSFRMKWKDIPSGQGPSIVPMWLTGLKKWARYGSMINLWGPDTYQFQSTCGFSVPTYKMCVCVFFFFSASGCPDLCVRSAMWNFLYAAFFTDIVQCGEHFGEHNALLSPISHNYKSESLNFRTLKLRAPWTDMQSWHTDEFLMACRLS